MALTTNLVSYWKLDESSGTAADSVGSNTLTLSGTASFATGKINNGISFGTGNDYASASHNANMNFGSGDFSVAGWFKHTDTTIDTTENIIRHYNSGGWAVQFKSTNKTVNFFAGSTAATATTNSIGQDTNWHHIACVRTGGTAKIYIDGVDRTNSATVDSGSVDVTTTLYFASNGSSEDFDGMLDEWGMWSRALTAGEVSQLWNSGNGSQYAFTTVGLARDSVSSPAYVSSASSLTFSHTCSGSNRILFVATGLMVGDLVSGVTYNGVSMTQIAKVNQSTRYLYLYYLIAPDTGTHDVVVSTTGSPDLIGANGISYTGAKQSGQPDASTTGAVASNTTLTTSVTTVADNCWAILVGRTNGDNPTASTNLVELGNFGDSLRTIVGDSNSAKTPAGSFGLTYTWTNAAQSSSIVASFAPATGLDVTISDTLSLSDTITATRSRLATITDTLSITDAIETAKGFATVVMDTLGITDAITTSRTFVTTILDTLALSDTSLVKKLWNNATKIASSWSNASKNSTSWTNQNKT